MITEIEIEGFKSLEKVHLKLGGLNLFIGANASGKSNFLEALRVLQGIAYGFTIDEVFNGKPKGASSEVWTGIRGGSSRARWKGKDNSKPLIDNISFRVSFKSKSDLVLYSVEISPEHGVIVSEKLGVGKIMVKPSAKAKRNSFANKSIFLDNPSKRISIAYIYASPYFPEMMRNLQKVSPSPQILHGYGQVILAQRMGESGENFASLVKAILKDPESASAYLSWLRQLVPLEAEEIEIREGALGEPLFGLKRGNQFFPAPILSDGTLRFAAITAAFFQPDMPDIITLEEIENGIHPSRLRLLMELLKSQSGGSGPQVFATTHSPVVLAWLEEKDYETTFLCKRDEETGASIIKPLSEIPHLIDLVRKQPIGELFTEGWLEGAF